MSSYPRSILRRTKRSRTSRSTSRFRSRFPSSRSYRTKRPSLVFAPTAQALRTRPSFIRFGPKGQNTGITVSNKEYICDIATTAGSSAFKVCLSTTISPTNSGLFPWLAGIAQRFDNYKFHNLVFHYESSCTSAATGQVLIAPDFDPSDSQPTSWASAASFAGANHSSVWAPLSVNCDTRSLHKRRSYYCDFISLPSPSNLNDLRESAVGRINVMIDSVTNSGTVFAAATTLGKLYVSYKVSLYEPDYTNTLIAASSGVGAFFKASTADLAAITTSASQNMAQYLNSALTIGSIPFQQVDVAGVKTWQCTANCELIIHQMYLTSAAAVLAHPTPAVVGQGSAKLQHVCGETGANYANITMVKCYTGDYLNILSPTVTGAAPFTSIEIHIAPYPYSYN